MSPSDYPAHWEADIVLSDGATAHLRPIAPKDADRLVAFYARVSDRSKYYRFFAPYPELSPRDVERFTHVDHELRVALVLLEGDHILAVGRFDQLGDHEAEVAFLVEDAHQGRGVGSVLLEHLAQAGREVGVRRFLAEVLPENRVMTRIFQDAGYTARQAVSDGVVHVEVALEPTERSLAVSAAREHRAEARSVQRLLRPASVAVIGASRSPDKAGAMLVRHLLSGGFEGDVYPVNRETATVEGLRASARVQDVPGPVDLAILAVPAALVPEAVADCAAAGVRGLVVVAGGFAELGTADGVRRQESLVKQARAHGMRVLGPSCLGLVNTGLALNASLAPTMPPVGPVGIFAESGALGRALLAQATRRGLGISTFVSAGNRADVSANDLLQYWEDDTRTRVIGVYLESLGNPRKFTRLARRISRFKPVVAVAAGPYLAGRALGMSLPGRRLDDTLTAPMAALTRAARTQTGADDAPAAQAQAGIGSVAAQPPTGAGNPADETVTGRGEARGLTRFTANVAPIGERGVTALFSQSGVIRVATIPEMLDVCLLLASQPLPAGNRVAVIGNSDALGLLAADTAATANLMLAGPPVDLGPEATPADYAVAASRVRAAGSADTLVAVYARTVGPSLGTEVVSALAEVADGARLTLLATLPEAGTAMEEAAGRAIRGVPAYGSPEEAIRALSLVCSLVTRRARGLGEVPTLSDLDVEGARSLAMDVLSDSPQGRWLSVGECAALLARVGVALIATCPVSSLEGALDSGAALGWEVVLKATADHLRGRLDQSDVWRNIDGPDRMRAAWSQLTRTLGEPAEARYVVQPMAPPGVPVVCAAWQDASFGPVLSFGLAGRAMELLGDRSYRGAPLTDLDAAEMLDDIAAAPMLGDRAGRQPVDRAALTDLLHRLSRLVDGAAEVTAVSLDPVLVTPTGLSVINAAVQVSPPTSRAEVYARRLA